jgi:DNA-binding transcriptional ArsR family regulator
MNDPPIADKFRALGDPIRIDILRVLIERQQPCTLSFLAAMIDRTASNTHYHLRHLIDAEVVSKARHGSVALFSINQRAIREMILKLGTFLKETHGETKRDSVNTPSTENPPLG